MLVIRFQGLNEVQSGFPELLLWTSCAQMHLELSRPPLPIPVVAQSLQFYTTNLSLLIFVPFSSLLCNWCFSQSSLINMHGAVLFRLFEHTSMQKTPLLLKLMPFPCSNRWNKILNWFCTCCKIWDHLKPNCWS